MTEPASPVDLRHWLATETAQLEALMEGAGSTCQLDRQRASAPSLKAIEGRYFVLRRAARLLESGQALQALAAEADKARALLEADTGIARQATWIAYSQAVLEAVQALQARAGAAWTGASGPSDG